MTSFYILSHARKVITRKDVKSSFEIKAVVVKFLQDKRKYRKRRAKLSADTSAQSRITKSQVY